MEYEISIFSQIVFSCKKTGKWISVNVNSFILFPHVERKLKFQLNQEHIHILDKYLESEKNVQRDFCREILLNHIKRDDFNAEIVLSYSWIKDLKNTFQISLVHLLPRRKMKIISRIVRATEKVEYNILNAHGLVLSEWKDKESLERLIDDVARIGQKIVSIGN